MFATDRVPCHCTDVHAWRPCRTAGPPGFQAEEFELNAARESPDMGCLPAPSSSACRNSYSARASSPASCGASAAPAVRPCSPGSIGAAAPSSRPHDQKARPGIGCAGRGQGHPACGKLIPQTRRRTRLAHALLRTRRVLVGRSHRARGERRGIRGATHRPRQGRAAHAGLSQDPSAGRAPRCASTAATQLPKTRPSCPTSASASACGPRIRSPRRAPCH